METHKITKKNAQFQVFESLKRSNEKRNEYKLFLLEGVKPINLFIENRGEIDSVLYSAGSNLSDWAYEVLESTEKIYEMSPELFAEISDRDEPSEIILVGKINRAILPTVSGDSSTFIVLDRIQNPGNLGSIIRSADAVDVDGVAILGHATNIYDPKTIRASIGACFSVPVQHFGSNQEFTEWISGMKQKGAQVIGTSAKSEQQLLNYQFPKHTILLVGNETVGLSLFLKSSADLLLSLPMRGSVSSLNVACATTVALYKIKNK